METKMFFEIMIADNTQLLNSFTIPNAALLLPVDDQYHNIHIVYTSNKMLFKVDGDIYYSSKYITKHFYSWPKRIYSFYTSSPWGEGINGNVTNICINLQNILFDDKIKCGQSVNGEIFSSQQDYYYYFNLSAATTVLFDSCRSEYATTLFVMNMNFSILYETSNNYDIDPSICGQQLLLYSLAKGRYILGIRSLGKYNVELRCNDAVIDNSSYRGISYPSYNWHDAMLFCEEIFGTTLATVINERDVLDAIDSITLYDPSIQVYDSFIGMYKDAVNGSVWQWVDETKCGYAGNCANHTHWHEGHPEKSQNTQRGTYLKIDGASATLYDTKMIPPPGFAMYGTVCNAPNSKYSIPNCTDTLKCWIALHCCNNLALNLDVASTPFSWEFKPTIAYYNSKLFMIGLNKIHYTDFQLYQHQYNW
eukprot:258292_1